MNCVAQTANYQLRSRVSDAKQRISDPIALKMLSQNESQSPGCTVSGLFLACVRAHMHATCICKCDGRHWCASPNVYRGVFQRSLQLKPNVITVFVKGLDKRLRGGYGACVRMIWHCEELHRHIPPSLRLVLWAVEGSAHHRLLMKWLHCVSAFCTVAPTDNDSSVFPTAEEAKVLEEEESKTGQPTHTWSSLGLCMHQGAAVCF